MGYRIGFDIGSTTIKAVVLDENNQICYKSYERHKAQVRQKALDKLVELKKYTKEPFKFAISGSGALGLSEQGELPLFKKYLRVQLELVNYTRKQIVLLNLVEKMRKFFSFKEV